MRKHRTDHDHHAIARRIGQRVAARRVALGLTQAQLAARLGMRPQQLSRYENAQSYIASPMLHQIAGLLAVDVGYFYAEESAAAPPALPLTDERLLTLTALSRQILREALDRMLTSARALGVNERQSAALLSGLLHGRGDRLLRDAFGDVDAHRLRRHTPDDPVTLPRSRTS